MGAIKTSKLTEKYQATVPLEVRKRLQLKKGDRIAFEIKDDETVLLKKVTWIDPEWTRALEGTLSEWNSAEDDEAYGDL